MERRTVVIVLVTIAMCLICAVIVTANEGPRRGPLGLIEWRGEPQVPHPSCPWSPGQAINATTTPGSASSAAPITPVTASANPWILAGLCGSAAAVGIVYGFVTKMRGAVAQKRLQRNR